MDLPLPKSPFTAADYLVWEADQLDRHEFFDGEVFAMAGAEDRHVTVSLNIGFGLREHLRGTPCRVFMSDIKLKPLHADRYFYPDLMVTCSPADRENRLIKSEPTLIVEVLSPSTAAYDRGAKFASYRQIPSLREYALVDIDTRLIEIYRLGDQGSSLGLWVLHPFDLSVASATLTFASAQLSLSAEQVFADVE